MNLLQQEEAKSRELRSRVRTLKSEVSLWRANCESYGEQYRQMLDRLIAAGFPIQIPSDSLPPYWQVTDIILAHLQARS